MSTPIVKQWTSPGTFTFVVPERVTQVDLCMIGGGGGGYWSSNDTGRGGRAGIVFSGIYSVIPGESITVVVGAASNSTGKQSKFGTRVCVGGAAGTASVGWYNSNQSRTTCYGTAKSGCNYSGNRGGEAGFGRGGSSRGTCTKDPHGHQGGGGACERGQRGNGGAGTVKITYSEHDYGIYIGDKPVDVIMVDGVFVDTIYQQ